MSKIKISKMVHANKERVDPAGGDASMHDHDGGSSCPLLLASSVSSLCRARSDSTSLRAGSGEYTRVEHPLDLTIPRGARPASSG